jgi:hypothetical protein
MAGAWMVQRRTGHSGWVDATWTFSLGLPAAAGMIPNRTAALAQRGGRLSPATNAERVCAEITPKTKGVVT